MSRPTLLVQIAFGDDPFQTLPTWTDVTSYVRVSPPIQIIRGRTSERSHYSAGTCRMTLDNRDRRFDPTYVSGPYYGDLKPGVRLRVTASGTQFEGYVTGWPQDITNQGLDATTTIECVDALAWLNRARVPDDMVGYTMFNTFTAPPEWHARTTDDLNWLSIGETPAATMTFGTRSQGASLMAGSASPSIQFDGGTMWEPTTPVTLSASYGFASFVMQTTQVPDQTTSLYSSLTAGLWGDAFKSGTVHEGVSVAIDSLGRLVWSEGPTGVPGSGSLTSFKAVNDGKPHHIVLVYGGDVARSYIYIDGVQQDVIRAGTGLGIGLAVIGNASKDNATTENYVGGQFYVGALQDLAIWDGVSASDATIKELYDITNGFLIESTSARLDRILAAVDFPASWYDSYGTVGTCGRLVFNGRTALDMLQELERTEQGYLFAEGKAIIFYGRYWHQNGAPFDYGAVSQLTFSDDGAAGSVAYSGGFGFRLDDLDIRNDITVNAAPAGRGRAVDTTSATTYGAQSLSIGAALPSAQLAADMAAGLLHKYGEPAWRSKQMIVYPVNGDKWVDVLALGLAHRITQEVTPMGVGSQVAHDMLIGRIELLIGPVDQWEVSILGEPVPPAYFILDSSALDGSDPLGF